MHNNIFGRNVQLYTCEYLRQENYINAENEKEFGQVAFVPFTNPEKDERFEVFSAPYKEEVLPYIELVYYSKCHKVVVTKNTGPHLYFSLEQIFTYDYQDFDIHQTSDNAMADHKYKLPNDPDTIRALVDLIGMEQVILPAFVYESKTKC